MSLLVDKDYLILQLRLAYLRKVDDHSGPRVITVPDVTNLPPKHKYGAASNRDKERQGSVPSLSGLDRSTASWQNQACDASSSSIAAARDSAPSRGNHARSAGRHLYAPDSAIVVAGLNDVRYQPELATLYSPNIVNEDASGPIFWAGPRRSSAGDAPNSKVSASTTSRGMQSNSATSGLGYTTTIYGPGRTGALGMRTTGRHATRADSRRRARQSSSDNPLGQKEIAMGKRLSKDGTEKPVLRRLSDLASQGNQGESPVGAGTPPFREIPILHVQGSSHDSDEVRQAASRRSSSLRMANRREDDMLQATIGTTRLRSQSSSHPRRPSQGSLLGSRRGSESASQAEDDLINQIDFDAKIQNLAPSVGGPPPPRPARSTQRTAIGQAHEGVGGEQMKEYMQDEGAIDGSVDHDVKQQRQRSASDDPQHHLKAPFLDTDGSTFDSALLTTHDAGFCKENGDSLPLGRSSSDVTAFSLASSRTNEARSATGRSEHSEEALSRTHPVPGTSGRARSSSFAPLMALAEDPMPAAGPHTAEGNGSPLSQDRAIADPHEATERIARDRQTAAQSPLNSTPYRNEGAEQLGDEGYEHDGSFESNPHENDLGPSAPDPSSSAESVAPITTALELETEDMRSPGEETGVIANQIAIDSGAIRNPAEYRRKSATRKSAVLSEGDLPVHTMTFEKRNLAPRSKQQHSALGELLRQHGEGPSNPFTQRYKNVSGSTVANGAGVTVEMYFPFALAERNRNLQRSSGKTRSGAVSTDPTSRSMQLSVRKDANMEELIGYSLYCYVEERWQPLLEETLPSAASEEQREIKLSTIGWSMRIVEDGEIDDDYPALDRSLTVGNFGADELAVCEATASQIRQNQTLSIENKKARNRPMPPSVTRLQQSRQSAQPASASSRLLAAAGNMPAGSLVSVQGTPIFSSSALGDQQGNDVTPSSAPIFLRVLVTPNTEVRYKTTLQVTSDRYLADVLETICKRRDLGSPDKWALIVSEKDIVVPLDRTVESLQGNYDLALVRRQDLGEQQSGALTSHSTNPNASIFKRISQPAQPRYQTAAKQLASTFKSYTVNRRMPTFLGRHERVLTIDGTWLHIIPTDTRAFHTHATTTSFPASSILSCTQSRLPSMFKLIVARETDQKRYDFEAESSKIAAEIVSEINKLLQRSNVEHDDEPTTRAGPPTGLAGMRSNSDKK